MKKKILSVVLILMLTSTMFVFTGCGNKEVSTSKDDPSQNSNEVAYETTGEDKSSKEEIEISEVKAVSENYAVVSGTDKNTYIIDKEGNYQGTINGTYIYVLINKNGYVMTKDTSGSQIVYDKNGNVLMEKGSDDINYMAFGISDDNYLLVRKPTDKSFSDGTSYTCYIIDVDGNIINEMVTDNYEVPGDYVGGNMFYSLYGNGYYGYIDYFYDAENNKMIDSDILKLGTNGETCEVSDIDSYLSQDSNYEGWEYSTRKINDDVLDLEGRTFINSNNEILKADDHDIVLNNNYYYSYDNKAICDYNGNVVKDLTDGNGATSIGYYNNQYLIKSGTGYYYILDDDFNTVLEPTELNVYDINNYGLMAKDNSRTYTILYDYDMGNEKELSYLLEEEPNYFVAEIENTDNTKIEYFNLNTQEKLVIYK